MVQAPVFSELRVNNGNHVAGDREADARQHDVEMPITEVIAGVMHDGLEIGEAVLLLASRSAKPERYGV